MRIRPHVNPLRVEYLTPRTSRLPVPTDREIEVELGCAEAWFLFERSAKNPGVHGVGLEIREELVDFVNERARAEGVNLTAHFANITVDLPYLFAPGSVARIYVNFPDPWFKKRHQKRRLVDDALVEACHGMLRPGGELFFQSDVWDLALDALSVIERHSGLFVNQAGPWSFWKDGNPYGARSRREVGCAAEDAPVWRILYRRSDLLSV